MPRDMKQKILATAEKLFKEHGYDGTTFQMIADEIGITKGTITYHFGKKWALMYQFFYDFFADIRLFVRENYQGEFNYYQFYCICYIYAYRGIMKSESGRNLYYNREHLMFVREATARLVETMYRLVAYDFKKELTDRDIYINVITDLAVRNRMFEEFTKGKEPMTIYEYCYYQAYLIGVLSRLDEATIDRNIERAFEFANTYLPPSMSLIE